VGGFTEGGYVTKETGYQFALRQAGIHTLPSLADKKSIRHKITDGRRTESQKKKKGPAPSSMICNKVRGGGSRKAKKPANKFT
jgi:hypothetical protein